MHLNPRHHSLAFIETGKNAVHHMMMELYSFDDVGQGWDIAQSRPEEIATTLGRHVNDLVTVQVLETISATGTADANLAKDSSAHTSITKLFGLESKFPGWLDPTSQNLRMSAPCALTVMPR